MSLRVLLIDDSENYVRLAHKLLRRYEYATNCDLTNPCWECDLRRGCYLKHAHNWSEATQIMDRYNGEIDVVLLDVHFDLPEEELICEEGLPGGIGEGAKPLEALRRFQGFHIMRRLRRGHGQMPVVLMTSNRSIAFNEPEIAAEVFTQEFVAGFFKPEVASNTGRCGSCGCG